MKSFDALRATASMSIQTDAWGVDRVSAIASLAH